MKVTAAVFFGLSMVVACGGSTSEVTNPGIDSGADGSSSDGGSSDGGADSSNDSSTDSAADAAPLDGAVVNHRPDDSQCQTTPPAGNCTLMMGVGCAHDSECTSGTNGRCVETTHGARLCNCTYDACMHDSDCGTGKLCACHGSAYTGGGGNTCIDGNCRVDADCGAGKYCSPTHGTTGCGAVIGYYCHTASDTCQNDSDCTMGTQVCAWSALHTKWECQQQLLCP